MRNKIKKDLFFSEFTGKSLAIGGLIFMILSLVIFVLFGSWNFSTTLNEEILGQYGDLIGGVIGSIFSLTSVILFYVSLKEQRKEIGKNQEGFELQIKVLNDQVKEFRAQKEEMQETRIVHNEQTKEFRRQTDISKLQQFDSSFYSLINVFIDLKKELNEKHKDGNYFYKVYAQLKSINLQNKNIKEIYNIIINKYIEVFYENCTELNHYFKTIYRIFKLIDNSSINDSDKTQYAKILRSQLTDYELLLLYYNYHSPLGEKVRPFAVKYTLFKHLQIIDRLEFGFNGKSDKKAKLSLYLNSLSLFIKVNYIKFNDLEEGSDINLCETNYFIDLESEITLIINTNFELDISFTKAVWDNQSDITKEYIGKTISTLIYDCLYLTKYKIPRGDEVKIEYIESDTNFNVKFTIRNIEII